MPKSTTKNKNKQNMYTDLCDATFVIRCYYYVLLLLVFFFGTIKIDFECKYVLCHHWPLTDHSTFVGNNRQVPLELYVFQSLETTLDHRRAPLNYVFHLRLNHQHMILNNAMVYLKVLQHSLYHLQNERTKHSERHTYIYIEIEMKYLKSSCIYNAD